MDLPCWIPPAETDLAAFQLVPSTGPSAPA
jgi:hypothetical protein